MEAVIVLAGGSGTRLWPASTRETPKQFLSLGLERSFLQMSVERGLAVNPEAELVVVTGADYVEGTALQLEEYAARGARITILPEPVGRNTAPAVLFAELYLETRLPGTARVLILSADHLIRPMEKFVSAALAAAELGAKGYVAIFGVPPAGPNVAYGYIEAGEPEGPGFLVKAFKEKPGLETAREYAASGRHYWNSGMFLFSLDTLREEFAAWAPDLAEPFRRLGKTLSGGSGKTKAAGADTDLVRSARGIPIWGGGPVFGELYEKLPSVSIDFAVMEKSRRVAMIRVDFEWNDVGSWDAAAGLFPNDAPRIASIESEGNAVFSDIPVALCGVGGLIVVIRGGRALVVKKGSSQLVRDASREMES